MSRRKEILQYQRNCKLGLIASLCLVIIIFLLYPYPSATNDVMPAYGESLITVIDIPVTNQNSVQQMSVPPQPQPVISSLFIEIDDPEILDDVEVNDNMLESSQNIGKGMRDSFGSGPRVLTSLPFAPRQVLWVVPSKDEDIEGFITFSLLIGTNGMVKEHRVKKNTIEEKEFVDNVIASIYKCKWAPVVMEGEKVEFWIELTYQ